MKRAKTITDFPVIKFGEWNIKYSKVMKYLKSIIDRNYTWIAHANYLKDIKNELENNLKDKKVYKMN